MHSHVLKRVKLLSQLGYTDLVTLYQIIISIITSDFPFCINYNFEFCRRWLTNKILWRLVFKLPSLGPLKRFTTLLLFGLELPAYLWSQHVFSQPIESPSRKNESTGSRPDDVIEPPTQECKCPPGAAGPVGQKGEKGLRVHNKHFVTIKRSILNWLRNLFKGSDGVTGASGEKGEKVTLVLSYKKMKITLLSSSREIQELLQLALKVRRDPVVLQDLLGLEVRQDYLRL